MIDRNLGKVRPLSLLTCREKGLILSLAAILSPVDLAYNPWNIVKQLELYF